MSRSQINEIILEQLIFILIFEQELSVRTQLSSLMSTIYAVRIKRMSNVWDDDCWRDKPQKPLSDKTIFAAYCANRRSQRYFYVSEFVEMSTRLNCMKTCTCISIFVQLYGQFAVFLPLQGIKMFDMGSKFWYGQKGLVKRTGDKSYEYEEG